MNIDILVVGESVLYIPVVKGLVIAELLAIEGHRYYHRHWNLGGWRGDVHICVCEVNNFLLDGSISNGHIAYAFLVEAFSYHLGDSTSFDGSNARKD